MKFYKNSNHIFTVVKDAGVPMTCSGQEMQELVPGTVDAAVEKHVPVVEIKGNTVIVKVGSVTHPMIAAHYIQWVALETNQGSQIKYLQPETEPAVTFALADREEVIHVYEYCNLHGLWQV